ARALDLMLRWCYPLPSPLQRSLNHARLALELSEKYQIDGLSQIGKDCLKAVIKSNALAAYAVACRFDLPDVAKAAAKATLARPLSAHPSSELTSISADRYQTLVSYHQRCGEVASAVADDRRWLPVGIMVRAPSNPCSMCCSRDARSTVAFTPVSSWASVYLWDFLARAAIALRARPDASAIGSLYRVQTFTCPSCGLNRMSSLPAIRQVLAEEVSAAVGRVTLPNVYGHCATSPLLLQPCRTF
ncbi:hypothetical protein BV25DRAFT_1833722, partial [Artomyces pyxidatus]